MVWGDVLNEVADKMNIINNTMTITGDNIPPNLCFWDLISMRNHTCIPMHFQDQNKIHYQQ